MLCSNATHTSVRCRLKSLTYCACSGRLVVPGFVMKDEERLLDRGNGEFYKYVDNRIVSRSGIGVLNDDSGFPVTDDQSGLPARVRDLFSPATAFGLKYRRCGSCHTPVFTWRPSFPGRRSSSVERATAQCHLRTIFVLIPATPEDIFFPATTASITLITVSWSWTA